MKVINQLIKSSRKFFVMEGSTDDDEISISSAAILDENELPGNIEDIVQEYFFPIIKEMKQDISSLSAEVDALKLNFQLESAEDEDNMSLKSDPDYEQVKLVEIGAEIKQHKKHRKRIKKAKNSILNIGKAFKYGTLRLMKLFSDPFRSDEAKVHSPVLSRKAAAMVNLVTNRRIN
jgi:regulator of replication initiation timing